ncbi:Na+/H+ antiporter NhaA [Nocardioides sp.]|uniref:Na+/H+ antiporter NhaA n=1 Tax=Nocardioides sp. TaxID=35761 RepID=UPI003565210A
MHPPQPQPRLFSRGTLPEASRIAHVLRGETTGGLLLMAAAVAALIWANSPASSSYFDLREFTIGPEALHLDLSLGTWAADGLLAIFFFVAGLELKREFVAGDLRDPRRAALPVAAAVGGMLVPAGVFVAVVLAGGAEDGLRGWAIPTATDIAFALAILAIISTHLPVALRTFLLTLAVVDDLLAIAVIAIFYTSDLDLAMLGLSLLPLLAFGLLVQLRKSPAILLLPLALVTWALVHESGVHATVAGVLLAFTVPVHHEDGPEEEAHGPAEAMEHLVRPLSAGLAVPVFAFFASGVAVGGVSGLGESLRDPVALGIVLGLVLGKPIGVAGSAWLLHTFTHADLDSDLSWVDVVGLSLLAGVGFTVSLLIGELAFDGSDRQDAVVVAVLVGSLAAGSLAAIVLRARNRTYRRLIEREETDDPASDPASLG